MRASVVLVTGPPRAGVTAMAAELRRRMPSYRFVESGEPGPPAVVVFVVSAVAPMTESDCLLADLATIETAAVIAVVAKIDDHLDWRNVVTADRERLGAGVARLAGVPWVGAAAAPRLGDPLMDELVGLLAAQLRDPALADRNMLRASQTRICRLRAGRDQLMRRRRLAAPQRMSALRGTVQQARLSLTHTARQRCAGLRTELVDGAAGLRRAEIAGFSERVRRRCAEVLDEVEADVGAYACETAGEVVAVSPPVVVADPPLASRRLETQLMTVLGAGFGLGVALVVTRLLAGLAPDLAVVGLGAGGVAGLATTAWVVRARALLHDRAVLQRWVADVAATVRAAAEQRVATGMLAAEAAMAAASAAAAAEEDTEIGHRIAALEAEIRELATARERHIRPE